MISLGNMRGRFRTAPTETSLDRGLVWLEPAIRGGSPRHLHSETLLGSGRGLAADHMHGICSSEHVVYDEVSPRAAGGRRVFGID